MMTLAEIALLEGDEMRRVISDNIEKEPGQVALSLPESLREQRAEICTQIKYLQRARTKLPSYYAAACIIPPLSYEQASSEQTAAVKCYQGDTCIDLTCGLGVDALYFSKRFRRVIAVERCAELAALARINFRRMGVTNIEVVHADSETFLQTLSAATERVDLLYVDPDRRSIDGCKLFLLEDCSPDVVALLPRLRAAARRIVIKTSPLFDVAEAFRIFGAEIAVEVVSLQGECKEVLIDIDATASESSTGDGLLKVTVAGGASLSFAREATWENRPFTPPYTYLLIPDVSLYKARLVRRYAAMLGLTAPTETGYCYGDVLPDSFLGRCFAIESFAPYQPKVLKAELKAKGIGRCTFLKKDFREEVAAVARALGVGSGGVRQMALTQVDRTRYALLLREV